MRSFGADDRQATRRPSQWRMSSDLVPVPSHILGQGSLQPSATGSLLRSAEADLMGQWLPSYILRQGKSLTKYSIAGRPKISYDDTENEERIEGRKQDAPRRARPSGSIPEKPEPAQSKAIWGRGASPPTPHRPNRNLMHVYGEAGRAGRDGGVRKMIRYAAGMFALVTVWTAGPFQPPETRVYRWCEKKSPGATTMWGNRGELICDMGSDALWC
jgi:hypothetical protein